MTSDCLIFGRFALDPANRTLSRDGAAVELNSRYFDALALLVRERGKLVSKERFHDEVWRGIPVTDEALTQCVRTLRRQLGDDAARPRFIETVPKHGYRFIAPLEDAGPRAVESATADGAYDVRRFLLLGGAGTAGAGVAGIIGGLFYGFVASSQPLGPGEGAVSVLFVTLWLTMAAALTGGAGVSFGIAATGFAQDRRWSVAGGAMGGLIVGGVVKLLGVDAFNLLLGRSPLSMTGAAEGLLLGSSVGLGTWLAGRASVFSFRRGIAVAGLVGGVAGMLIPLLGGRLMGGSLDLLSKTFPASRLRLDVLGTLFGESGLGPVSQVVTGALEGMLFAACVVGAMLAVRRSWKT
jgi:DNA-binding winged helix-turn-helix (wHTH) protein